MLKGVLILRSETKKIVNLINAVAGKCGMLREGL